jgi:predicted lipoprotein with Yx(FWY)xxD motif
MTSSKPTRRRRKDGLAMAAVEMMHKHGRKVHRLTARARGSRVVSAAALTGAVLTGTTLVLAGPASTAGAASSPTIRISTAKVANLGTVLTTSTGLTLYRFVQDPSGAATCTGGCAKIWPPLLASKGAHIAGPKGVQGLSLIKVSGGHFQVAFHHVALYRFEGDKKKGQAKGQGVANAFYAVLKSGLSSAPLVSSPPATTTPTTQAPTTTTAPHADTPAPPVTQATQPPTTQPPPTTTTTTTAPSNTGSGGAGF